MGDGFLPGNGRAPSGGQVINRQLVEKSDILVAIFWTRVGSPSGVAESGTIEEIEVHLKFGKPAMIYFSTAALPHEVDTEQLNAVRKIRKQYEIRVLVRTFEGPSEFERVFSQHLASSMVDYLKRQPESDKILAASPVDGRENDLVIQTQFFQLLSELPKLLPERATRPLRQNSVLLSQVLRIYFREARRLGLNREEILHDLAEHQLKDRVPPGERFKRRDLLGALEKLRSQASRKLRPLLDEMLGATLSDEQRRLLILQAAYDQDVQELTFLGATGVIGNVLNEMPDLVNFLTQNFPRDP